MARAPKQADPDPVDDSAHPRCTHTLLGHEKAVAGFLEAWAAERVHHAWLICGPEGTGKATLAYHLAKAVLSGGISGGEDSLFGDPMPAHLTVDPEHPAVSKIEAGSHPNLFVVERKISPTTKKLETRIPVDRVRKAVDFLHRTADGWKIVLVDSVDEMNRNAANAFLKVLEEPPKRTLMLLVSHAPGRLLPTIRSRCRRLEVDRPPEESVARLLETALPDRTEMERSVLASLADGSVGQALELAEAGGADLYQDLVGVLSTLPNIDLRLVHNLADRVGQGNESALRFETIMKLYAGWLARLTRFAATGQMPTTYLSGETDIFQRLAPLHSLERWIGLWENTRRMEATTSAVNLDKRQTVLNAILASAPVAVAAL